MCPASKPKPSVEDLRGTKVTHTGAQQLEQVLSNCVIIREYTIIED